MWSKVAFMAVLLVLGTNASIYGQDCGVFCQVCTGIRFEGTEFFGGAPFDMFCRGSLDCNLCGPWSASPLAGDIYGATLLQTVAEAGPEVLPGILEEARARILLNPSRNLLAARMSSCSPDTITAVYFLTEDRTRLLQSLGLPDMEKFFSTAATSRPSPARQ